jgi:phage FluMu protein Com
MAIEFRCPQCTQLLRVGDGNSGKTAKCPRCSALAKVPTDKTAVSTVRISDLDPATASPVGDKTSNPFSDTESRSLPFGEELPPLKSANEPTGEVNPYRSPVPMPVAIHHTGIEGSARSGLPWESQGKSLRTWWKTFAAILWNSSDAFRRMRLTGGFGTPIGFATLGLAIGSLGNLIFNLGLLGLLASWGMGAEQLQSQVIQQVALAVLTPLLGPTLLCLIQALVLHVCLVMLGGEKNGFEATFRVCAYTMGAFGPLNAIPLLGPCVGFAWQIIATVIGLAEGHETSGGKAGAAFFIAFSATLFAFSGVMIVVAIVLGISLP